MVGGGGGLPLEPDGSEEQGRVAMMFVRAWVLLGGGGWGLAVAQTPTLNQEPVELPVYTVQGTVDPLPPESWRYTRIEGFEVLSDGSVAQTRHWVEEFQRFHHAISLVWPVGQAQRQPPALLVLCEDSGSYEQLLPKTPRSRGALGYSAGYQRREHAALVIDFSGRLPETVSATEVLDPGLEGPAQTAGSDIGGVQSDPYRALYREYIHLLLSQADPPAPAWFEEGLCQLLADIRVTDTAITVGKLDREDSFADADDPEPTFNLALKSRSLLPLEAMFAPEAGQLTPGGPRDGRWAVQCYAFVHWGLYGNFGQNQKPFLQFLVQASREPVTEMMFRHHFKRTYKQMLYELKSYTEISRYKVAGLRTEGREKLPPPAPFAVREATEAEVGRIKGRVLRLAGRTSDAREALIAPYRRGVRDTALLAELGLAELERGERERARTFLLAATRRETDQPRAYLELARILAEDRAAVPDAVPAPHSPVLALLTQAAARPPPLAEVYALMLETWLNGDAFPDTEGFRLLDAGVRAFPGDATLICRLAELKVRAGAIESARSLVAHGLRVLSDPAAKERLRALQLRLPAAPPS